MLACCLPDKEITRNFNFIPCFVHVIQQRNELSAITSLKALIPKSHRSFSYSSFCVYLIASSHRQFQIHLHVSRICNTKLSFNYIEPFFVFVSSYFAVLSYPAQSAPLRAKQVQRGCRCIGLEVEPGATRFCLGPRSRRCTPGNRSSNPVHKAVWALEISWLDPENLPPSSSKP